MGVSGTVGFLGFGNMGRAIAEGLARSGAVSPSDLLAFDLDSEKLDALAALGGRALQSPEELAQQSDTLVLASKPQDMARALDSIAGDLRPDVLLISIAAGISIAFIQDRVGPKAHVARVMPNTPALAGAGAAAYALSENCMKADAATTHAIFEAVGIAEEVPESHMDAVTALSGSGPAYYFAFVEACTDAAADLGMEKAQASRLAAQTLYGAGKLLCESGESASTLRERVTSKGGTTAAALAVFDERGLAETVQAAMRAAAQRSKELGH